MMRIGFGEISGVCIVSYLASQLKGNNASCSQVEQESGLFDRKMHGRLLFSLYCIQTRNYSSVYLYTCIH